MTPPATPHRTEPLLAPPPSLVHGAAWRIGALVSVFAGVFSGFGCDAEHNLGLLSEKAPVVVRTLECLSVVGESSVDYGLVGAHSVAVRQVGLANLCEYSVELDLVAVESDDDFWLLATPKGGGPQAPGPAGLAVTGTWETTSLAPGESFTAQVAFRGTENMALAAGELLIEASAAGGLTGDWQVPMVANTASRCLSVEPLGTLDLGCRAVGVSHQVSLKLKACGGQPVHIEGLKLVGAPEFALADTPQDVVLAPGEQLVASITYIPTAPSDVRPLIDWSESTLTVHAGAATKSTPVWSHTLRAFARETTCDGLSVALRWVTATAANPSGMANDIGPDEGSDLDLHVMHPHSLGWFRYPFDAFWINRHPNWGDFSLSEDDPVMTSDSIDGTAPEVMTMLLPEDNRAYRIGVHHWADRGMGPSDATIEVRYFGQLIYERTVRLTEGDLWDVGLVSWPNGMVTAAGGEHAVVIPHFDAPCDPTGCKGK